MKHRISKKQDSHKILNDLSQINSDIIKESNHAEFSNINHKKRFLLPSPNRINQIFEEEFEKICNIENFKGKKNEIFENLKKKKSNNKINLDRNQILHYIVKNSPDVSSESFKSIFEIDDLSTIE